MRGVQTDAMWWQLRATRRWHQAAGALRALRALTAPGSALLLLAGCDKSRMPMLNPVGSVGEGEAELFYISVGIMLAIIVPIMIALLWFAWRYRASGPDDGYDPSFDDSPIIHQVTLFVPLFTIAVLGGLTWIYTHKLDPYRPIASAQPVYEIQAVSLDYKWLFIYPQAGVATINELVAPTGRAVTIRITSDPMMTALFIPGLISQIYAMPGMETRANFLADRQAVLQGSNVMYSGPGFETQRFKAKLVAPQDFNAWLAQVKDAQGSEAKHEPTLDQGRYDALTKISTNDPVIYFASVQPDLFVRAVRKYMPHYEPKPLPNQAEYDAETGGARGAGHVGAGAGQPAPARASHTTHGAPTKAAEGSR